MAEIISDSDIATILGIPSTTPNLAIWNTTATALLENEFGVSNFLTHTVTNERTEAFCNEYIVLNDFPVTAVSAIKDTDQVADSYFTGATFFLDPSEKRRVRAKDSSNRELYFSTKCTYLITYTAGYTNAGAVPSDLKMAVAQLVGVGLSEKNQASGISSKTLGEFSVSYDMALREFIKKSTLVSQVISKYKKYVAFA